MWETGECRDSPGNVVTLHFINGGSLDSDNKLLCDLCAHSFITFLASSQSIIIIIKNKPVIGLIAYGDQIAVNSELRSDRNNLLQLFSPKSRTLLPSP